MNITRKNVSVCYTDIKTKIVGFPHSECEYTVMVFEQAVNAQYWINFSAETGDSSSLIGPQPIFGRLKKNWRYILEVMTSTAPL